MAGVELGGGGGGEVDTATAAIGDSTHVQIQRPASCVDYHWSRHLKCHVCFGYLRQPHTLTCGHSFCRGCLLRLAQNSKSAHPDVPLRYLHLPCPTCRAPFPSATILKGRASTSFLIQNLVADWKKERKRLQSWSIVTLRSVSTQTDSHQKRNFNRNHSPARPTKQDMREEFQVRMRLDDHYIRTLSAAVNSESSEETELKVVQSVVTFPEPSINLSDTSTASSVASTEAGLLAEHGLSILRNVHFVAGDQRSDLFPGRMMLISVWCIYSMVVVGIAQPMLPYMILLTLFFIVTILR